MEYIKPIYEVDIPLFFKIFYYGLVMPVAFVGNTTTLLVVAHILWYRPSIPDTLVGGLVLNDFLTCLIVFTPSIIAELRGEWFGQGFCCYHAIVNVW